MFCSGLHHVWYYVHDKILWLHWIFVWLCIMTLHLVCLLLLTSFMYFFLPSFNSDFGLSMCILCVVVVGHFWYASVVGTQMGHRFLGLDLDWCNRSTFLHRSCSIWFMVCILTMYIVCSCFWLRYDLILCFTLVFFVACRSLSCSNLLHVCITLVHVGYVHM